MVVLKSFKEAVYLLYDCPILFLYVIGVSALTSAVSSVPVIGVFILLIVFPAIIGGIYEIFHQANNGVKPTVDSLLEGMETHFRSLTGVYSVIGFLGIILGIVFAFLIGASSLAESGTGVTPSMMVLLITGIFSFILLFHIFQFSDVIIVVDDEDAVTGLKKSCRLVLDAPIQTLGYTAMRLVSASVFMGVLGGLVLGMVSAVEAGTESGVTLALILLTVLLSIVLVVPIVLNTVFYAYHITFYNQLKAQMTSEPSRITSGVDESS